MIMYEYCLKTRSNRIVILKNSYEVEKIYRNSFNDFYFANKSGHRSLPEHWLDEIHNNTLCTFDEDDDAAARKLISNYEKKTDELKHQMDKRRKMLQEFKAQ